MSKGIKVLIAMVVMSSFTLVGCGTDNLKEKESSKGEITQGVESGKVEKVTLEEISLNTSGNKILAKDGNRYLYVNKNEQLCLLYADKSESYILRSADENYIFVKGELKGNNVIYMQSVKYKEDSEKVDENTQYSQYMDATKGYRNGVFYGVLTENKLEDKTSFVSETVQYTKSFALTDDKLLIAYDGIQDESVSQIIMYDINNNTGIEIGKVEKKENIGEDWYNQMLLEELDMEEDYIAISMANILNLDYRVYLMKNDANILSSVDMNDENIIELDGIKDFVLNNGILYGLKIIESGPEVEFIKCDIAKKETEVLLKTGDEVKNNKQYGGIDINTTMIKAGDYILFSSSRGSIEVYNTKNGEMKTLEEAWFVSSDNNEIIIKDATDNYKVINLAQI